MTTKYNRWTVVSTDQVWEVFELSKGGWWVYRAEFDTHAGALAYADRMARTVTVELPADPNKYAPYIGYEASSDAPLYHYFGAPNWELSNRISLERSQIEPFALALLAHHYKQEQQ